MTKYIIALGSNINAEENMKKAILLLKKIFHFIKQSKILKTKPLGFLEQADFLNCCVLIETEKNASDLKFELKEIENLLGRIRTENKNGPRTIDLDIIAIDGEIVNDDFYERDFLRDAVFEILKNT